MAKIGFIGTGNMGYAILKGLLKVYGPEELMITDADEARKKAVSDETGVLQAMDNHSLASQVKYVVLAVKPQYYSAVLHDIKDARKRRSQESG